MIKNPLISIITVVYNGEAHLQQTIDSVHNQTYKNIEYIIVDGGSTDKTLSIIEQNRDKITKWVSEPDNGLYDAMNKGVKMASGELIGTINSDDWYELDAVENVVNAYLDNQDKLLFHGDINHIRPDQSIKLKQHNPSVFLFKYYGMMYNHPSMFIHKEAYKKHQYNTKLLSLSDYQFTLSIFYLGKDKLHYVNKVISNFRLGGISAHVNIKNSLKEGYIARKEAGMGVVENVFSVVFRAGVFWTRRIIKTFR